jgi:hypothetical protein
MDDVRPKTLRNLRLQAEALCRERAVELFSLADRLTEIGHSRKKLAA